MSNKRFRTILCPLMVLVLVTAIAANVAVNHFAVSLDMVFGGAEPYVVRSEGSEDWNGDYYNEAAIGTPEDQLQRSLAAAKQISDEGIVLLKNNDKALPLDSSAKVTVLGHSSVEPVWGGSGSGGSDLGEGTVTPRQAFEDAFPNLNTTVYDKSQELLDSGNYVRGGVPLGTLDETSCRIGEFPVADYGDALDSVADYNEVGIVIVSRVAGEGNDLPMDMEPYGGNAGEHMLELNDDEKALLQYAKQNFKKVVVVLNAATPMELGPLAQDDGIDAILVMGFPGNQGFASLADILVGKVNPSGHTVDTWYADFTQDPTWQNMGNFAYTSENMVGHTKGRRGPANGEYLEYEEGIYLGYRYYETAAHELGEAWYNDWQGHIDDATYTASGTGVVYPFGYGLSYTTFDQKITDHSVKDGKVSVTVQVTNTGDVAGKDVVQVYYTAPYTKGGIEKAYVNLVKYDKTGLIEPGATQDVTIEFDLEDMASYDWQGEGCYVLDAGTYTIRAMKSAHEQYDSFDYEVADKVVYNQDNPRQSELDAQAYVNEDGTLADYAGRTLDPDSGVEGFVAATNQFDELNDHMSSSEVTNLTRADLEGSFPTRPSDERSASDEYAALYDPFDYTTDPELGNVEGSHVYHAEAPTQGADNGISLIQLRGKSYYDPMWDQFLDQIVYDADTLKVVAGANYQTQDLAYLGKPATNDHDGPVGFTGSYGTDQTFVAAYWPSTTVLASSYNTDLAYEMGNCIGSEMAVQDTCGWYGPAMNAHRTPFGGRNYEYYSEDPVVSGTTAMNEISGAAAHGVYAEPKHFALNDEEVNRNNQCSVWVNEQALREIYLKPFEICVKDAWCDTPYISDEAGTMSVAKQRATRVMMTCHFQVGADHSSECYALLTQVLRNEWGFNGFVESDMYDGVNMDKRIRAGEDISMVGDAVAPQEDQTSPTALWAYRRAIHNICYTQVNSRAMSNIVPGSIIKYGMRPWLPMVIGIDVAIAALLVLGVVWMVMRKKKEQAHPEMFAGTPEGDAALAANPPTAAEKRRKTIIICVIAAVILVAVIFGIQALLAWLDQM